MQKSYVLASERYALILADTSTQNSGCTFPEELFVPSGLIDVSSTGYELRKHESTRSGFVDLIDS